ncbi:hypothetical protein [Pseudoalteromonas phenolica]|nr:hypothetical protein [Pseudoalteromonas phenolica]
MMLPQSFSNTGQMPIKGGDAKSGIGDSAFTNHGKLGGLNYNKGMPQWVLYVGLGLAAFWILSAKR